MTIMSNVLARLPKAKTSADFDAALVDLEREHAEAEAAVGELEAGRESAIFSGGNLGKLESDISEAQSRVRILDVALTGARKRREAAIEGEATAALEAVAAAAGKLTKALRAELIAFASVAEALTNHAETVTSLRREIAGRNTELRTAGRGDLAVDDPTAVLSELVGRHVHDPVKSLIIPEFWPRRAEGNAPGDGPALLKLTK